MLLSARGIAKSFGSKDVLKTVDVLVDEDDRVGLVGPNGSGKSTLLKILIGEIKPDVGDLQVATARIAYLPQLTDLSEKTIEDIVSNPFESVEEARLAELERLMSRAAEDPLIDLDSIAAEYARLQEEVVARKPHELEERKEKALLRLGLTDRAIDRRVEEMSGGERTRVMLARALLQADEADLLILDEPTSHLDIDTTESLEDFLKHYPGAVIVVSHDRYFLDRTVSEIWDLDDGVLTEYKGTYTEYVKKKELELDKKRIAFEKNQTERERNLRIADDLHARLRFASTHKTRLKMVDRMDELARPKDRRSPTVSLQTKARSGRDVLTLKDFSVKRGGKRIFEDVSLELTQGDKIGVFGPNGGGKTTLLKALIGELPWEGEYDIAPGAVIGYYAQDHDGLDQELTPEEQLALALTNEERGKARSMLAQLMVTNQQMETKIRDLSGGERAKVALAVLTAQKSNLLLLDEPTNYLDLPSREAVERALRSYDETLILVTHDRYLLDAICTKVAHLKDGSLEVFGGTYSDFRRLLPPVELVAEAGTYWVLSGFTDWETHTKYRPGDKLMIAPQEIERFRWAIDAGKIKKGYQKGLKKVSSKE
ncbi:MAG TPA: ABC-F family ATP-binding cassette domain-containing protein [Methanomassiliicoccales archaeon]|nr:ABC-F family ATP-binding cassette domain-containing protein [Methanomassiliicoccales archaeon]